jgi:hypothetical protein
MIDHNQRKKLFEKYGYINRERLERCSKTARILFGSDDCGVNIGGISNRYGEPVYLVDMLHIGITDYSPYTYKVFQISTNRAMPHQIADPIICRTGQDAIVHFILRAESLQGFWGAR